MYLVILLITNKDEVFHSLTDLAVLLK